jgi:CRISPR-associated exonuclease Cas4
VRETSETRDREPVPLSLVNDFLYCRRRAALKMIEGWRGANEHTVRGGVAHEHADLPGYEVAKGVTLLRALPVFSERLGLSGKCDIVELLPSPPSPDPRSSGRESALTSLAENQSRLTSAATSEGGIALLPVEFKAGRRRSFENDDVQLCAQALCLEEMFGVIVPRGAVFHARSKRRREVDFTPELRARTEQALAELRTLLEERLVPPARYIEGRCEECSLFDVCLPKVTCEESRAARIARQLFEI